MTQYLGSCDGSGGDGRVPPGSPASPARRRCKSVGRGDSARDGSRSHCITDYFKTIPKPDGTILCSPEKRNGKAGIPVLHTEHLRKSISSPKQNRRKKLLLTPPDRSPIIDAFLRSAKIEKDSPDNSAYIATKAMYPKVVVRKLFRSDGSPDCSIMLKDNRCMRNFERSEKCPFRTRTPLVENSRECKMDYVDPDTTSSDLNKWASPSENDSLKKETLVSWCQKTACSRTLQPNPISSSFQLPSLETPCRERQLKEKNMQSKQQPFSSVNKILGTAFSNQDTRDLLKLSCSASWESSSDESSSVQASKVVLSSGRSSDKTISVRKGLSPSTYFHSRTSSGISKHVEHPGKRKRISLKTDMKNSSKLIAQRLDKYNFSSSLEKHNSEYSKGRTPGGDAQLEDINPPASDMPFSAEYIDVEENKNSLFSKESKDLLSRMQSDGFFEALTVKVHKRDPPHHMSDNLLLPSTSHISSLKVEVEKTGKDISTLSAPPESSFGDGDKFLPSKDGSCDNIASSSCVLSELHNEGSNLHTSVLERRSLSDNEDEVSDCNLDSSDDEEELLSLDEILAQSSRPSPKSPEQINEEDTPNTTIPLLDVLVSYMNRLEHLLEEKEEFRRVDELERQLQQAKQESEMNSPSEELSNDGELSTEHSAFIKRFSIINDAIPDQHPGENIFQIANAGKLFNQHNLDLRNVGFHPQNPIEKYLLGSGVTQQLFVILEGLLVSAYHSSPCPVPILKWMFQMMSIHSDCSVSRKILHILMTLTIKHASSGNDQPRPWIPTLLDIATVLINVGIPFSALFPLLEFQPPFTEGCIMSEMQNNVGKPTSEDLFGNSASFFLLIETNLCNMAKFLRLCVSICPECYTDKEIFLLLLLLFKLSLEKELKQFPLVDLECLIIKLLENIREWNTKMSELCLAISDLSSHHHDLLWLVQFVPNWITRGRQVRRHLSLIVISKLLKSNVNIPSSHDQQMSLLCSDLVKMKPSNLLKKRILETMQQRDGLNRESLLSELEPQAYYLTYVLLHFVREASNSEITNPSQRNWLLKLSSTLEKHVKCDIREDARLFYRTKVKDLVARTYSKWQQIIHSSQLTQGKIHDFWDPSS
ncbi:SMC5-SMC6 complex localization factor protein 2 isoform X2 [Hemicordylus capensis]|uniref:SMC5-SMC6 complex localization factor protein 2 isoform X2 n=1 Tax=Hemicordylus capensis TaxID=884348 RepID=UPI002303F776|nr:SMC5-SMC6 complex localization factor protein 2 isoform X2 [Hemicordylus capensis]